MPPHDPRAGPARRRGRRAALARLRDGAAGAVLLFGVIGRAGAARAPTIVAVRVWPASEYTRVTIESDAPLSATHVLTEAPYRLGVDLQGLELSAALREIVGQVRTDDPFIARVRVGQYQPRVVRIVFDLKQAVRPEQFALEPVAAYRHRLVFDLFPVVEADPLLALLRERGAAAPASAAASASAAATTAPAAGPSSTPALAPPTDPVSAAALQSSPPTATAAAVPGSRSTRPPPASPTVAATPPASARGDALGDLIARVQTPAAGTGGAGAGTGAAGGAGVNAGGGAGAAGGAGAGAAGGAGAVVAGAAGAAAGGIGAATAASPGASSPPSPSTMAATAGPPGAVAALPSAAASSGMPDSAATRSPAGDAAPPSPRSAAATAERRRVDRLVIVALDPGHGGEDPGAIGPTGLREKDVVLAVARRLRDRLNALPGLRVMLTRDDDYFVPLHERVRKARRVQADLFVSLHADAFPNPDARGASVFALSRSGASSATARWMAQRENAADAVGGVNAERLKDTQLLAAMLDMSTTAQIKDSLKLGHEMLTRIGQVGRLHKAQVEQAGFAVLKAPDIPSVLVETAFISNPEEEAKLRDEGYRARLVEAMTRGIQRYFARNPPLARQRQI